MRIRGNIDGLYGHKQATLNIFSKKADIVENQQDNEINQFQHNIKGISTYQIQGWSSNGR